MTKSKAMTVKGKLNKIANAELANDRKLSLNITSTNNFNNIFTCLYYNITSVIKL